MHENQDYFTTKFRRAFNYKPENLSSPKNLLKQLVHSIQNGDSS